MKLRYTVETTNKNGLKEKTVKDFSKNEVLLGRGAGSDILLSGKLMSLAHARLTGTREGGLSVEDLQSLSGVLVNDRLVSREDLKVGDKLKIGDFEFEITKEDDAWGLFEERSPAEADEDAETMIARQQGRLLLRDRLPSFSVLSAAIATTVLVFFFAVPLWGKNLSSWNSGPISNNHKMIELDCGQCHQRSFKRVTDNECLACHKLTDHAKSLPAVYTKHPGLNLRCANCHIEHSGLGSPTAQEAKLCTDCHGKLKDILADTKTQPVGSFDRHPEFRVSFPPHPGVPGAEYGGRVSLSDKAKLKDPTPVKLNHEVHLRKDLAGAEGPVTLGCHDCHQPTADQKEIKPISFEAHCASCHPLEFDARLPGKSVPHGDPAIVYNYLYAQYAKLFLASEGVADVNDVFGGRVKPGGQAVERGEKLEYTRRAVEEKSRATEEAIFTRTACYLCHVVSEAKSAAPAAARAGNVAAANIQGDRDARFVVLPPKIPGSWMTQARFDHGAHQEVACESCHTGVRKSTTTADVLLPGVSNCVTCHQEKLRPAGKVVSNCVMCHSYHDPIPFPEDKKRAIEKIMLSATPANAS